MENLRYPNSIPLPYEIYYKEPYNKQRRAKIIILSDILRSYKDFDKLTYKEQHNIFQKIENSCYESAIKKIEKLNQNADFDNEIFCGVYDDICGNLFSNLDSKSLVESDYLIKKVLAGKIEFAKLGTMTSQELCPHKYTELLELIKQKNNVQQTVKYSDMDKCGKCGERKCGMQRMQTRSLDEGTCYRYTCLNCGNSWMKG